jgi:hypothetical protein
VLNGGGGKGRVCYEPPTSPVQDFLECTNKDDTCFNNALAASVASIQFMSFVAMSFLGVAGGKFMNKFAVPLDEEGRVMVDVKSD